MMTFKDFLAERAMNAREFSRVLKTQSDSAKVGFEFEMAISPDSKALRGAGIGDRPVRGSMRVSDLESLDNIAEYFDLTGRTSRKIERAFEDWVEEQREEFVNDNYESYIDDNEDEDDREDDARENAGAYWDRKYRDGKSILEWVKYEHGTLYDMMKSYNLDPLYGWEDDVEDDRSTFYTADGENDVDDQKKAFVHMCGELSSFLGAPVRVPGTEAVDRSKDWIIVPDGSIESHQDEDSIAAEVVSPPYPLGTALKKLETMFKWMAANNCETNSSTGLHINISVPNITQCDPLKLVLFLGDEHVLEQFERSANKYAVAVSKLLKGELRDINPRAKGFSELRELATKLLSVDKYRSVNLKKLNDGYLEFRIAGNNDYHMKYGLVKATTLRFVSVLELACDPEAEKSTYIKKLVKMFGQEDQRSPEEQTIADQLEAANFPEYAKSWTELVNAANKNGVLNEREMKTLAYCLPKITIALADYDKATSKQRIEFRRLTMILKKAGIDPSTYVSRNVADDIEKLFGLKVD